MSDLEEIAKISAFLPTFVSEPQAVAYVTAYLHENLSGEWAKPLLRAGAEKYWRKFSIAPTYLETDNSYSYHCNVLAYIIFHIKPLDTPETASAWMTKSVLG